MLTTSPPTTTATTTTGTFESRDHSKWLKDNISTTLQDSIFTTTISGSGSNTATCTITKIKSITGDAEIVSARGKTKYIYDISCELEFKITISSGSDGSGSGGSCSGVINIEDITADLEYESSYTLTTPPPKTNTALVKAVELCVRKPTPSSSGGSGGIEGILFKKLNHVHKLFLEKS